MRKVTTLLLAFCITATAAIGAKAQQVADLAKLPVNELKAPSVDNAAKATATAQGTVAQAKFTLVDGATKATAVTANRAKAKAKVQSIDDLEGKYVMSYKSLVTTLGDGGSSVTIKKLSADSIEIQNFWTASVNVHAKVNADMSIEIPNQKLYDHTTYGPIDLAVVAITGKPDRTQVIKGQVNADGTISISSWWAAWVVEGSNKDNFLVAGYDAAIEKSNATMDVTYYGDATTEANDPESWNVIVTQKGKNLVSVKNLGNHGQTLDVVLKADSTFTIAPQITWAAGTTMGDFYPYMVTDAWAAGKYTSPITGKGTETELSWGAWVMLSTNKYYTGKLNSATIKLNGFKFEYPQAAPESFTGAGTEADPYQIKTLEDLVALAEKVNNDTERSYGGPLAFHTKTFLGKNFKLMNDIDMTGYRFEPIGNKWNQRFAGTFDGDGHTLKGLDVNTGTNGYAALFGMADTASVIKNLNVNAASVQGSAYYAGIIGGFVLGTIENCNTTGSVQNEGITAAGIVGLGQNVKNCSFVGTVVANGGFGGGIAGQVYGEIDNCHAAATIKVGAPADTYTGGGVVGTLYGVNAVCRNSYFSGIVDGTLHANLYIGGVAGQAYRGTVESCFAQADLYGYDTESATGGVVGQLMGGNVSDSYFNGYVQSISSRMTGGITGCVRYSTNNDGSIERQSSIKNCYFAGRLKAESYLYDVKTEIRETLGKIYNENTVPTIENIYYDKQMVPNFGSLQYSILTSELTSAAGPKGFSADKWTFTEGYYPRVKGIDDNDVAKLSASVLKLDSDFPDNTSYITVSPTFNLLGTTKAALVVDGKLSATGHCGSIEGNTYKLNETFGNDTIAIYSADSNIRARFYTVKAAPKFFDGNGTAEKPFLIKNKADLMKLGELTTNVEQYFAGSYFLQTADIDMENDTTFLGICNSLTNQAKCRFAGTYDGGGHAIHNMVLTYVSWTVAPTETSMGTPNSKGPKSSIYKGFVGSLDNSGVIKNLSIAADCRIDTWGYAGTFVGYNYGTVENCKNYSDFYSYSTTAGGIVGYNNPGALVKGCYNEGTVYCGYATAGGITGVNTGTVEECLNVGDVVVKQISTFVSAENKLRYAGGISGSSMGGVFKNCVNAGHCYAMGGMVAGIASSFNSTIVHDGKNDVYTSMNYGTLFTNNKSYISSIGNLGSNGYNKDGKIEGFYYDAQLTGQSAAANDICPGAIAATTKQLTSGEALDGFSTDIWLFSAGQYPTLKRFADEPKAIAAAKAVFTIADGETVKGLKSNATLSADGAKWQLAKGDKFAIEGNTLKVPSVTEFTYDTLTVALNGFTRPIELAALKPVPLEGNGTEADPYQIKTTADWNNFAQYMAESQNQFDGSYLKVMNDIDFTGVTLIPMAYDGVTKFGATLLGNNKTLSGIKFTGTATYQGVFLNMGATSSIHDLTLKGDATSAKGYVGAFAGRASGSFYNCHNKMRVEATAAGAAGFVAQVEGSDVKFVDCTNDTSVVGTKGVVGGFVANTTSTSGTKFINCQNNGNITNNGSAKNVAGFVAQGYNIEMRNCVNTGEINASKCTAVAGFVGYIQGADTLKFISCHNDGEVLGASSGAGLVGSPNTSYSAVHTPYYIDSCYNTANIETLTKATYSTAGLVALITPNTVIKNSYNTGNILSTQAVYTGGLWGADFDPSSADEAIYVNNCYNTGDVAGVNYAGGIAGSVPAYTYVTDCYNTGAITANLGGGGIAGGLMGNNVELLRCWNSGQVTTTANGAGGINGYGNYTGTVTNCFNTGNVACGTQSAGGLGGQTRVTYRNCYNTGTVSGPTQVGGLVGQSANSTTFGTSFYNCYNAGKVVPVETSCGNLVGTTAAKQWGETNVIENCYYVTSYGTFEQDTIGGTGITIAALAKAQDLAGNWSYGSDYELPVIPEFADNDNAKASAAAPVIDDADTFNGVTKSFHIGCPAGVEWSTNSPVIKISGDWASITGASTDEVQLTSTCGQFSHVWTLKLNTTSSVADNVADKAVVGERYFTVSGLEVAKPSNRDGQVYVVVRTYSDGTTEAAKILDR